MRVSIAGVSVDDGLRDAGFAGKGARTANGSSKLAIRHRPVRRDLSPTMHATRGAPLIHMRGNRVSHSARLAQACFAIVHAHVIRYGPEPIGKSKPLVQSGIDTADGRLLDVHKRLRAQGPRRVA